MKDYEKKYKEAIERAKKYKLKEDLIITQDIFPELAESEDEKIRKELITHCRNTRCVTEEGAEKIVKWITWLEKQAQKPAYTKEYDFHGIKFIPKFAKGDIIKDKKRGEVSTIEDFSYDAGLYTHTYGQFPITIQDNYELVEQKPAFEMKTPEESLGIDSDTYNKIVDECVYELEEQKPAWSEEDEEHINTITSLLEDRKKEQTDWGVEVLNEEIDWLKSLKDRVQPQPKQEWSMYDETILKTLIDHFEYKKEFNEAEDYDIVLWLKSLRPQNRWKPSDEQMGALNDVISSRDIKYDVLSELWKNLKKLKG